MKSYSPIHIEDFLRVIANPVLLNAAPDKNLEKCREFRTACSRLNAMADHASCDTLQVSALVRAAVHFLRKAEQFDYFNLYGKPFIIAFAGAVFGWNIRFLLARNDFPQRRILILGETGSGKEQVARLVGEIMADLNHATYVAINAANLSETLLEAELFGHEKGAFTGAHVAREGILKQLDGGGVLFLDEISETPPSVQARLLRFLETGEYRPLGSGKVEKARITIIAASNRVDLHQDQDFRADLLYRLSESVIQLPPLRQIVLDPDRAIRTFDHLIVSTARDMAAGVNPDERESFLFWVSEWSKTIAKRLALQWAGRPWPGNIRECCNELRQIIQTMPRNLQTTPPNAGLNFSGDKAESNSAPALPIFSHYPTSSPSNQDQPINLKSELESLERTCYINAAQKAGSIESVARLLGVTRQTASRRMKNFGIRCSAETSK